MTLKGAQTWSHIYVSEAVTSRMSPFFHTNHMLHTLDFSGSWHWPWAMFNFPLSTILA